VDLAEPLTSLVNAALGDDTEHLVDVAEAQLHRPLGLVSRAGEPLGCAPVGEEGRRALAVAEAAARTGLVAPPSWQIVRVTRGRSTLGFLAIGSRSGVHDGHVPLELVRGLLAEHVQRRELTLAQRGDFVRRLVRESAASAGQLRREARDVGLALADAYWPAVLAWRHIPAQRVVADGIAARAGAAPGALTVALGARLVLLHPDDGGPEPPTWFEHAVRYARQLSPAGGAQAVVADSPAGVAELSTAVAELEALWRLGPRAESQPLLNAGRFALDCLLGGVADSDAGRAFVAGQLGPLLEWDRQHRGDLLYLLEAALDFPRHEQAAGRCFMHRNTFRHRLRLATDVLGRDLEEPDVRLAVHVALKLRNLAATR
jgi:hypothetical protein